MNNEHIHHTLYSCCDSNISDEAIFSIRFHFTIEKQKFNKCCNKKAFYTKNGFTKHTGF